ncbi:MAG: CidA/LrgA family protein [Lautropia sp.]
MNLLRGLAALLLFQALGEAVARFAHLALPGPVIGMVLLLPLLQWPAVRRVVAPGADALLAHLSLLFVPIGVGVVTHLDVLAAHGLALFVVLVLSTWVGLATTAMVLKLALKPAAGVGVGEGADG